MFLDSSISLNFDCLILKVDLAIVFDMHTMHCIVCTEYIVLHTVRFPDWKNFNVTETMFMKRIFSPFNEFNDEFLNQISNKH